MSIRVVQLGSPRLPREGLRIGTVRRPPRGIRKSHVARKDFYDVWLPVLSPSATLVRAAREARSAAQWRVFSRKFYAEMRRPEAARILDLLAAMSSRTNFSVGCYCRDETRCHRGILRKLLIERGARVE
jgi:uncharacterized protein YeaO (DUF488 family)